VRGWLKSVEDAAFAAEQLLGLGARMDDSPGEVEDHDAIGHRLEQFSEAGFDHVGPRLFLLCWIFVACC
jgi:hypothetical protein